MQIDPEAEILRDYMSSPQFERRAHQLMDRFEQGFHPSESEMSQLLGLPIEIMRAFLVRSGLEMVMPPEGRMH